MRLASQVILMTGRFEIVVPVRGPTRALLIPVGGRPDRGRSAGNAKSQLLRVLQTGPSGDGWGGEPGCRFLGPRSAFLQASWARRRASLAVPTAAALHGPRPGPRLRLRTPRVPVGVAAGPCARSDDDVGSVDPSRRSDAAHGPAPTPTRRAVPWNTTGRRRSSSTARTGLVSSSLLGTTRSVVRWCSRARRERGEFSDGA